MVHLVTFCVNPIDVDICVGFVIEGDGCWLSEHVVSVDIVSFHVLKLSRVVVGHEVV